MTSTVLFLPTMFEDYLENSRLKKPVDFENYKPSEYPHFHVFMKLHLGNTVDILTLEENANIIADIPDNEIYQVTTVQLVEKGLFVDTSDDYLNQG